MVEKLSFGEPLAETEFIAAESGYLTGENTLVMNLSRSVPVMIGDQRLMPLRAAVFRNVRLDVPGEALAVTNYGTQDLENDETAARIKREWKSVWELTHAPRNIGVEYYKSPAAILHGSIKLNYCFGERQLPAGLHREHRAPDFDELHLQLCGRGFIQLFRENDEKTLYESLPLCPGTVNDPIWNEAGIYPWHRYYSQTRCLFLVIEADREEA